MSLVSKSLALLALFISVTLHSETSKKHDLTFSAEDQKVDAFAQLPPDVLALLLKDKDDFPEGSPGLRCDDHEGRSGDRPEILCRTLPISSTGESFLVIGVGSLRGAHIVPFWIFHKDQQGARLLLKIRSDEIEIAPNKFNGYSEIRSTWIEGAGDNIVTDTFHFNGHDYQQYHRQTQHQ